jgi:small redox-active disulfide protein 2
MAESPTVHFEEDSLFSIIPTPRASNVVRATQVEDQTMSKIQILGPGCQKCRVLYERTKQAAEELGLECEIEKVTDVEALMNYGVMSTPAIVVDGW